LGDFWWWLIRSGRWVRRLLDSRRSSPEKDLAFLAAGRFPFGANPVQTARGGVLKEAVFSRKIAIVSSV